MAKIKRRYKAEEYIKAILAGDRIMLSRSITVIESQLKEDEVLAREIIKQILPFSGKSIRIGLTGAPGVGKSTFIEAFGKEILKEGKTLAVLTIDPSSSTTKGSILGDKTRMSDLSRDERVYIRPSPAGETLGGVASKTRETMLLCEAAGFNTVIIETVGVGQSETLVKGMVDFFLLLMLAGSGDELQGIKRGIMELADMVVITKADGDNLTRAKKTRQDFEIALNVLKTKVKEVPKVLISSATTDYNIAEVWTQIKVKLETQISTGAIKDTRNKQAVDWMHELIKGELIQSFYSDKSIRTSINKMQESLLDEKTDPTFAAKELLYQFWKLKSEK